MDSSLGQGLLSVKDGGCPVRPVIYVIGYVNLKAVVSPVVYELWETPENVSSVASSFQRRLESMSLLLLLDA